MTALSIPFSIATTYIRPFGTIFLNLIKWVVTPLVFFSIMSGVISMRDIRKVGSIGVKTVAYYLCTTSFAITIGLFLSPIGVFCLMCPVVAENGPEVLGSLAKVLFVACLGYLLHAVIVYSAAVRVFAGITPLAFFKGMAPAILFAFSSASSVGSLPINMDCSEKLGADRGIASFVLPLGATINMEGTAIYQGVCAIIVSALERKREERRLAKADS